MRRIGLAAMLFVVWVGSALAATKEEERLANAGKAFDEIMSAPDRGIPGGVLDKADCVVIIPGMKKGGFIVGGRYGKGMVSCRDKSKTGWGAPAMLEMGGGSFGLQIGASEVDVVMLVMERKGMDSLLKSKFTLGGDASVAGGPVGRAGAAETDALMSAKILSYSRSRGVFAGLELKGATLNQDNNANKALYGKEIDARDILGGEVKSPGAAKPVIEVLAKYSPQGKPTSTGGESGVAATGASVPSPAADAPPSSPATDAVASAPTAPGNSRPAASSGDPAQGGSSWLLWAVLILVAAIAAYFLFGRSRSSSHV